MFRALLSATLACTALIIAGSIGQATANDLERDRDPVVLTGSDIPWVLGLSPDLMVGFRYDGSWVQVPIQIDERDVFDFGTIYNNDPTGYTVLTYADTSTFTGPDSDPAFDADDELVFMAAEAGELSLALEPPGTIPGSGVEVAVTNPLNGLTAYVYLFETDGSLHPWAGTPPLNYDFVLLSGDYKTTYNTMSGPNPEDTHLTTSAYQVHFADRWIRDETRIFQDGATGVDVLDRHRNLFAPGNCTRSEDTFSGGEGAFMVNHAGPVRALRGYVGANSGPTTYRIHHFYEEREDVLTALRVHAISGILDIFDYSSDATGMVFRDDLNTGGVTIDGVPDGVTLGQFSWEMITGLQGTLALAMSIETDIPGFDYSSYYSDDVTPPETQCTGDDYEYGASGLWEQDPIPNTDPGVGPYNIFKGHRRIVYGPPDQDLGYALAWVEEAGHPLTADASPYVPGMTAVEGHSRSIERENGFRVSFGPNPLRNELRVRFSLPVRGPVAVYLYDVSGRRVATVARGAWGPGEHEVICPTADLPPGVYLARATGPNGVRQTFRIVLLR